MNLSRRGFLRAAAAGPALPAWAKTLKAIGVQLYTVRGMLPEQPKETLAALDQMGYRQAEAVAAGLDKIWPALEKTRLKPVSIHVDRAMFGEGKEAELDSAIADARRRGFAFLVCPMAPDGDGTGLERMRRLAGRLNRAGEKCRAAGLQLCYHNHAFEFDPGERRVPIDVLLENADSKLVALELDIFWASVAGFDPVAMLKRYAGRVPVIHIKDKAQGLEVQYNQNVPKAAFKEVGSGILDIPAVLHAAADAGVRHYFVELDQTPGNPLDSLRRSYDYLRKVQF